MNRMKIKYWKFTIIPFIFFLLLISGSVSAKATETIQVADLGQAFKNLGAKIKNLGKKSEKNTPDIDEAGRAGEVSDAIESSEESDELNETIVKGNITAIVVNEELRETQQRLHNLGFNPGPIDGKLGAKTKSAILSFQQKQGLPQNGHTSEQLLSELRAQDSTEYAITVDSAPGSESTNELVTNADTMIQEAVESKGIESSEPKAMGVDPAMEERSILTSDKKESDNVLLATHQDTELEPLDNVPYSLILYKYAPEAFTDAFLLERTKNQFEKDQYNYRNSSLAKSHVFVFSKSQVEGRVAEFAANELLPVYKEYLNNLVDSIQDQFGFSEFKRVNQLQFDHAKKQLHSEQRPEQLMKLEAWQLPVLKGTMRVSNIPVSFSSTNLLKPRKVKLILDKDLTIPPLAMDSSVAERMWATQLPSCSQNILEYTNKGLTPKEADAAAAKCTKTLTQVDGVLVTANVSIAGVETTEKEYVINVKLTNVEIGNSHLKWSKTLAAENFPNVEYNEDVSKMELTAEQQSSQPLLETEANLHILGIRVGMILSEADALIRKAMAVGTVYSLERNETALKFKGYGRARIYISEDGTQLVSLIVEKTQNSTEDEVLGVVRSVYFTDTINTSDLALSLTKLYGEPKRKQKNLLEWGTTKQWCGSLGTKIGLKQKKNLRLIEGKEAERDILIVAWDIDPKSLQDGNPYENECSYALVSNYLVAEKEFRQGLANHAIYYDRYAPLLSK